MTDQFAHLEALDFASLHQRLNVLKASPVDSSGELSDPVVFEIVHVLGLLRRRSAGPPKALREKRKLAAAPQLDML